MSDDTKKAAALSAAISMLGLSLGVSAPADAQYAPVAGPQGTQGVLIGLNQPSSQQYKSEQWKSEQLKSEQFKSQQLKSQQFKSQQLKMQSNQVKLAPQP